MFHLLDLMGAAGGPSTSAGGPGGPDGPAISADAPDGPADPSATGTGALIGPSTGACPSDGLVSADTEAIESSKAQLAHTTLGQIG
ncbi:MAG: hypothetical protein OXO51_11385 [Gemmatimonadota bacterium]|nr:hypothetical protein [Gemmatimonadota bacterium]